MVTTRTLAAGPRVSCEVCLKEIPKSEAQSAEALDYVAYFCGLDCYEEWVADRIEETTMEAGTH